jgi:soluble lytic murein transglycosylase-like protein
MRAVVIAATSIVAAGMLSSPAHARQRMASTIACATHAPQAARRSGLPVDIVLRVMFAESRGDPGAVSPKGAMGCMQIMPATWRYLRARYRLGGDPFEPRMNMIAGALYLAQLVAQFGLPGAWSAYNAGPGRYRRYITRGIPLPAETVAYTARISGNTRVQGNAVAEQRWQEAGLFMARTGNRQPRSAESTNPALASMAPTNEVATRPGPSTLFPLTEPALAERE